MPKKLKAISLRQPWAEEIMLGHKTSEYRKIPTKVRGPIYIYASLERGSAKQRAEDAKEVGYEIDDLPRKVLIGTVEITDCTSDGDGYEWHLANPKRLPKPLPSVEHPQPIWFHPFGIPDA